jgi:hypothetical protein
MELELRCPRCACGFPVRADATPADQFAEREPWYALGDGETIEDSLHAALTACGPIRCPQCRAEVPVSEESLNEMALEVLAHW